MGPSVTVAEAAVSVAKRRERDEQLAAWCAHIVDPALFLARVAEFDVRSEILRQNAIADELEQARERRESAARGDLVRLRDGRKVRLGQRLPAPRPAA